MNWFKKIVSYFKKPQKTTKKVDIKPEKPVVKEPELSLKDLIIEEWIETLISFDGLKESGKNRHKLIDEANKWAGVPMGSPYCLSFILHQLHLTCVRYKAELHVPHRAATQLFWKGLSASVKQQQPIKNGIVIWQSRSNASRGHAAVSLGNYKAGQTSFQTVEANTNAAGSRDGDGIYVKEREMDSKGSLKLLGFIDPKILIVVPHEKIA